MTPIKDLVVLTDEGWTFGRIGANPAHVNGLRALLLTPFGLRPLLEALLEAEEYRGFPIVRTAADNMVIGYVSRLELESAIGTLSPSRLLSATFAKPILRIFFTVKTRETGQVQPSTPCFFMSSTLRGPQLGPPSPLEPDDFSTPTTPSGKGHARSGTAGSVSSSSSDHQRREEVAWVNFKPWVDEVRPLCVSFHFLPRLVLTKDLKDADMRQPRNSNGGRRANVPATRIAIGPLHATRGPRGYHHEDGTSLSLVPGPFPSVLLAYLPPLPRSCLRRTSTHTSNRTPRRWSGGSDQGRPKGEAADGRWEGRRGQDGAHQYLLEERKRNPARSWDCWTTRAQGGRRRWSGGIWLRGGSDMSPGAQKTPESEQYYRMSGPIPLWDRAEVEGSAGETGVASLGIAAGPRVFEVLTAAATPKIS